MILEGLSAIEMLHDLLGSRCESKLPIFNKLHSYFSNKDKDLEFRFDELVDL